MTERTHIRFNEQKAIFTTIFNHILTPEEENIRRQFAQWQASKEQQREVPADDITLETTAGHYTEAKAMFAVEKKGIVEPGKGLLTKVHKEDPQALPALVGEIYKYRDEKPLEPQQALLLFVAINEITAIMEEQKGENSLNE